MPKHSVHLNLQLIMNSNTNNYIAHIAKVVEVGPVYTELEIVSEAACSSCHAKSLCGMGESKTKTVVAKSTTEFAIFPGDEVEIILKTKYALLAVLLVYVIPVFLMLILALISVYANVSELITGASILLMLVIHCIVIRYIDRKNKLPRDYEFTIRKKI